MIISTEAIVLKNFDLRETSKIAVFYSKEEGKVKGVLKGIRKDPKKFGSRVDKFSANDIVYYRYSRSELHLVSQCDLKEFFFPVREDYKRNLAANYACELVDSIMPLEEKNAKVYELMINFLRNLETVRDIDKLVHIFQIKILLLSGFKPHLDSCIKSGRKISGKSYFSVRDGGLVHPDFADRDARMHPISQGAISSMLHIEGGDWSDNLRLGLTSKVKDELKYILNNFLVYHLEKRIKSASFL